jgi:hypothetical protein
VPGAEEFDFPIRGPNDRFASNCIRVAAVRALLAAHRACFVRTSVDVNDVRHSPDYIANCFILLGLGNGTAKSRVNRKNCSS